MDTQKIAERLAARTPRAPLFPRAIWDADLSTQIKTLKASDTVRAGLLLWNDDLEASHTLSQSITTPTGSLWHAVMHRREGDASNSIYWWRKTGAHPAFELLPSRALKILALESDEDAQRFAETLRRDGKWNPEHFVRACEKAGPGGAWCEKVQHEEFAVFLEWCRANE